MRTPVLLCHPSRSAPRLLGRILERRVRRSEAVWTHFTVREILIYLREQSNKLSSDLRGSPWGPAEQPRPERCVLAKPMPGARPGADRIEAYVEGCLTRAYISSGRIQALSNCSPGANRAKGDPESRSPPFLPLKFDEIDLITPSATKINEVRRATLIDSKAALDEERKDVAL